MPNLHLISNFAAVVGSVQIVLGSTAVRSAPLQHLTQRSSKSTRQATCGEFSRLGGPSWLRAPTSVSSHSFLGRGAGQSLVGTRRIKASP